MTPPTHTNACASCGLRHTKDCPNHTDMQDWWRGMSCYVPPMLMTESVEAGLQAIANERAVTDWRAPLVEILHDAESFVTSERSRYYGSPSENHQRIAALWNAWLTKGGTEERASTVTEADAAMMMLLLKVARLMQTPDHRDSIADIVGYALCYRDCVGGAE